MLVPLVLVLVLKDFGCLASDAPPQHEPLVFLCRMALCGVMRAARVVLSSDGDARRLAWALCLEVQAA